MTDAQVDAVERWALEYLDRLSEGGRRGVLLGGSIARGQQWAHSDLEAGLLTEEHDRPLAYFNVDSGRGVEIIQLSSSDLAQQVEQVEAGDLDPVATWPIQLYRARVVHDSASGLLARFTAAFDRHLFAPEVVRLKIDEHVVSAADALSRARDLLADGKPRAACCEARLAMNESILVLHWRLGELPRSQNRTDSRLRDVTARHDRGDFYRLYRDTFGLDDADTVIAHDWPTVRDDVLALAGHWAASEFFEHAVDSTFSWGENGGILTVYRLYVPLFGRPGGGVFDLVDDADWTTKNLPLLRFLGLAHLDAAAVAGLVERIAAFLDER
ncbi:hypothetical protein [Streptodolium elevatio]